MPGAQIRHAEGTPPPDERRVVRRIGERFEDVAGRSYQNCSVIAFDGEYYVFSHRAILTLVTTATCNAACSFCSNEVTFTPNGPYLECDDRLDRALRFAEVGGVTKVAYTGGEPTANPTKLYELACAVNPRFQRSRMHTNGFGLAKKVPTAAGQQELLPALIRAGLNGTSISVAHHEYEQNRIAMRFKGRWSGLTADELRWIASYSDDTFKARLSCVLTPEGVSTVDEMLAYLEWGYALGFRSFIFRSCSQIPEPFQKATDFSDYNEHAYIPIEPIVGRLADDDRFVETYQQHKTDSHVHVYSYRGDATVDVDESSEEVDPDPKIRRLNVMPDGATYTSWIDPRSYLFADEAEIAARTISRELPLLSVS